MRLNLATADPIGHAVDTGTKLFNTIEASRQRDIDNSRQAALDRRQTKIDERQEEEWQLRKAETELRTGELKKKILNEENTAELTAITLALQKGVPFNALPPDQQERGRKLVAEFYHGVPGAPSSPDEIGQRRATWDYMSKIGASFDAEPQQPAASGAIGNAGGKQMQAPIKITDPTLVTPLNGTVDPSRLNGQYKDEKGVYYTQGVSSAVFDPNRNAFTVMLKAVRPGAGPDGKDEVFEVPVTEGRTNSPNDPIKWITVDKLKEQATGHQQLFALGDYTGFNQLPAEEQLRYFDAARAKYDPEYGKQQLANIQTKREKDSDRRKGAIALAAVHPDFAKPIADMAEAGLDATLIEKIVTGQKTENALIQAGTDSLNSAIAVAKIYGGRAAKAAIAIEKRLGDGKVSPKSKDIESKALWKIMGDDENDKNSQRMAAATRSSRSSSSGSADGGSISVTAEESRRLDENIAARFVKAAKEHAAAQGANALASFNAGLKSDRVAAVMQNLPPEMSAKVRKIRSDAHAAYSTPVNGKRLTDEQAVTLAYRTNFTHN